MTLDSFEEIINLNVMNEPMQVKLPKVDFCQ